jgi:diacylglycerol O-acyltransferase
MERMSGEDASFIHLERMGEPCHTLKMVVLDTGERGHPVTLDELRRTVAAYLPLYPRARQRVVSAPVLSGLPFWVDDPDFDLDQHVSECELPAPGGRHQLDDVCSALASERLDLVRPLWDATLVHGLEGGRQAVVFRIHHALTDGMGVVRLLERVTSSTPRPPAPAPTDRWSPEPIPSTAELLQAAIRGVPHTVGLAQSLLAHGWRKRTKLIEDRRLVKERDDLRAPGLTAPYTWTNPGISARRLCATGSLPFADLLVVKERAGCTLNGVMLAVLAGALRRESEERGCGLDDDMVCGLGMAMVGDDATRLWGNNLTNFNVSLHTTETDPLDRLHKISRSVTDTVAIRRTATEGRPASLPDVAARLGPTLGKLLAYRVDKGMANLAAANVPGPASVRYVGDVAVAEFYSFAIVVLNAGMNVTAYRYDSAMRVGVLVAPEVHRRPDLVIDRMDESLEELLEVTATAKVRSAPA